MQFLKGLSSFVFQAAKANFTFGILAVKTYSLKQKVKYFHPLEQKSFLSFQEISPQCTLKL